MEESILRKIAEEHELDAEELITKYSRKEGDDGEHKEKKESKGTEDDTATALTKPANSQSLEMQQQINRLSDDIASLREQVFLAVKGISALGAVRLIGPLMRKVEMLSSQVSLMNSRRPPPSSSLASTAGTPFPAATPTTDIPHFGGDMPGASESRSYGQMRIWTGTWNLAALDPFAGLDMDDDWGKIEEMLSQYVAKDYDLYVLGVQEGLNDRVYDAFAKFTNCYRLPLNTKLNPARDMHVGVRSRRMAHALSVQSLIEYEAPLPGVNSAADMVS